MENKPQLTLEEFNKKYRIQVVATAVEDVDFNPLDIEPFGFSGTRIVGVHHYVVYENETNKEVCQIEPLDDPELQERLVKLLNIVLPKT